MYKLIYTEFDEEIIVTSTDEEPLLLLLKEMFRNSHDEFGLVFYGKVEKEIPYISKRGTGHKLPIEKEKEND